MNFFRYTKNMRALLGGEVFMQQTVASGNICFGIKGNICFNQSTRDQYEKAEIHLGVKKISSNRYVTV